jgi:hypothetical protein
MDTTSYLGKQDKFYYDILQGTYINNVWLPQGMPHFADKKTINISTNIIRDLCLSRCNNCKFNSRPFMTKELAYFIILITHQIQR